MLVPDWQQQKAATLDYDGKAKRSDQRDQ